MRDKGRSFWENEKRLKWGRQDTDSVDFCQFPMEK